MKRLLRWTFNGAVVASAFLCAAFSVLWTRSYFYSDWVVTRSPTKVVERKRGSAGLCRSCGYDLRATPNKCPECGTVPKKVRFSN